MCMVLISGKTGEDRFKQYSGMSTATEDTTDGESAGERPTSPRAAPVGKDDEIAPSKVVSYICKMLLNKK